jgi:hypothetical protein
MISDLYKRSDAVSRTTQLPSTWFKIRDATKHSKVLEMVKNATAQTKSYYELGRYCENGKERNWVGRWYLRRSFQNAPRERGCKKKADVFN